MVAQNGWHCADDILKDIFLNENVLNFDNKNTEVPNHSVKDKLA